MNIRKITTVLALSFAAALPALASDAEAAKKIASVEKWFAQYDRDGDERLTADEFSMGKSYFKALDMDQDGVLTKDEAKTAVLAAPKRRTINWKKMDTDGDGYVTVREWTEEPEEFDKLDLDRDRVLSSYDRDLAKERGRAESRLAAYDKDKDDFVSRAEWPADEATFYARDRNRDGKLTLEELMEDVKRKQ